MGESQLNSVRCPEIADMSAGCGVGFVEPDSSDVAVRQRKKLNTLLAGRIRATPPVG